jgi:hypothetical protein
MPQDQKQQFMLTPILNSVIKQSIPEGGFGFGFCSAVHVFSHTQKLKKRVVMFSVEGRKLLSGS